MNDCHKHNAEQKDQNEKNASYIIPFIGRSRTKLMQVKKKKNDNCLCEGRLTRNRRDKFLG